MRNRVGLLRIGDELEMDIVRDGDRRTLVAIIAEPKLTSISGEKLAEKLAGAVLAQMQNPDNASQTVIVVAEVAKGSPAWYARLQRGDYILSVNRKSVDNLKSLRKLLKNQQQILLSILRGNRAMFVLLK